MLEEIIGIMARATLRIDTFTLNYFNLTSKILNVIPQDVKNKIIIQENFDWFHHFLDDSTFLDKYEFKDRLALCTKLILSAGNLSLFHYLAQHQHFEHLRSLYEDFINDNNKYSNNVIHAIITCHTNLQQNSILDLLPEYEKIRYTDQSDDSNKTKIYYNLTIEDVTLLQSLPIFLQVTRDLDFSGINLEGLYREVLEAASKKNVEANPTLGIIFNSENNAFCYNKFVLLTFGAIEEAFDTSRKAEIQDIARELFSELDLKQNQLEHIMLCAMLKFIMAHEIGHIAHDKTLTFSAYIKQFMDKHLFNNYKKTNIPLMWAMSGLATAISLSMLRDEEEEFTSSTNIIISLGLGLSLVALTNLSKTFLKNTYFEQKREIERQADLFGSSLNEEYLKGGFLTFYKSALEDKEETHPFSTHPSPTERANTTRDALVKKGYTL